MNFCSCGKLSYIQRLNSLGILEYLCLEHIDQKTKEAIYNDYKDIYGFNSIDDLDRVD